MVSHTVHASQTGQARGVGRLTGGIVECPGPAGELLTVLSAIRAVVACWTDVGLVVGGIGRAEEALVK